MCRVIYDINREGSSIHSAKRDPIQFFSAKRNGIPYLDASLHISIYPPPKNTYDKTTYTFANGNIATYLSTNLVLKGMQ